MAELHLPRLDADQHPHLDAAKHVLWALCGTVVVLFIFFAALGAIEPSEAEEVTVVVLVLTVVWSAHAWRGLWQDERRER
jgi:hypothetical protein